MRLINTSTLQLKEFVGQSPPYAILSHTWDEEEVTFKDIQGPEAVKRKGYSKIKRSCQRAAKDGFQYIWVDTCCIDQTSSAELSEAINSMFRWYEGSEVCYAYLCDVPSGVEIMGKNGPFSRAKWFTRGWTLQELLAPQKVEFYNNEWLKIGTVGELATEIMRVTGIDKAYLTKDVLFYQASVAQRMCWASRRSTTREEDIAYCLLGIFGVHMPLVYGEGARAFQRLQQDVMKNSGDHTLFAWGWPNHRKALELFAASPADFITCRDIIASPNSRPTTPFSMTNRGLDIELPLCKIDSVLYAILNCRHKDQVLTDIGLPLYKIKDSGRYCADNLQTMVSIPQESWKVARNRRVLIANRSAYKIGHSEEEAIPSSSFIIRKLPAGHFIHDVSPREAWLPSKNIIKAATNKALCQWRLVQIKHRWFSHNFNVLLFSEKSLFFRKEVPRAFILRQDDNMLYDLERFLQLHSWSQPSATCEIDGCLLTIHTRPILLRGKSMVTVDIGRYDHRYVWPWLLYERGLDVFYHWEDHYRGVLARIIMEQSVVAFITLLVLLVSGHRYYPLTLLIMPWAMDSSSLLMGKERLSAKTDHDARPVPFGMPFGMYAWPGVFTLFSTLLSDLPLFNTLMMILTIAISYSICCLCFAMLLQILLVKCGILENPQVRKAWRTARTKAEYAKIIKTESLIKQWLE